MKQASDWRKRQRPNSRLKRPVLPPFFRPLQNGDPFKAVDGCFCWSFFFLNFPFRLLSLRLCIVVQHQQLQFWGTCDVSEIQPASKSERFFTVTGCEIKSISSYKWQTRSVFPHEKAYGKKGRGWSRSRLYTPNLPRPEKNTTCLTRGFFCLW